MDKLIDLAERCEKAAGPDRVLDGAIASLCLNAEVQKVAVGPDYRREEIATIDRSGAAPISRPVPALTASLDAAMTLVPEGLELILKVRSGQWRAIVWPHGRTVGLDGNAPTAALALCAAACRARSSILVSGSE